MKKGISVVVALCIIGVVSFGVFSLKGGKNEYLQSEYHNELIVKGFEGANGLTFDHLGNIYIALQDQVLILDSNRQKKTLFKTDGLPVYDLEYLNGRLYYTAGNKLSYYDLNTKESDIILDNIPNDGVNKECKILVKDNSVYLAIGSATNSGIVDTKGSPQDLSPKKLVLEGRNYSNNTAGPFVQFGTKVEKSQEVKGSEVGNASIIRIDLDSGKKELYCYGVRNVKGIDYNSEGKIFGVVGGIEEKGLRALCGDVDYIYELKGGEAWYGWPDYSGGDPVNSPRFRVEGKTTVNFILGSHPTKNPPAPFYQHDTISTLSTMAVDREGILGEKNSIFTFDSSKGELMNILKEGAVSSKVKLYESANVSDIKIQGNDLFLLDSENGYIVKVFKEGTTENDKIIIYCFFLILTISMIVVLVIKLFLDMKKSS